MIKFSITSNKPDHTMHFSKVTNTNSNPPRDSAHSTQPLMKKPILQQKHNNNKTTTQSPKTLPFKTRTINHTKKQ